MLKRLGTATVSSSSTIWVRILGFKFMEMKLLACQVKAKRTDKNKQERTSLNLTTTWESHPHLYSNYRPRKTTSSPRSSIDYLLVTLTIHPSSTTWNRRYAILISKDSTTSSHRLHRATNINTNIDIIHAIHTVWETQWAES